MAETVEQYAARMAKAGGGELRRILYREVGNVSQRALGEAKRNVRRRMKVRSGRLWSSIRSEVKSTNTGLDVRLMAGGSTADGQVRYARIQERGGTVKPTRSTFLTIPLGPAKYPSGVSRFDTARDAPNLTLAISGRGQYMLVNRDTGEPWYLLRRQVKIRPKWYLRDAMRTAAKKMPDEVRRAVKMTLVGA